MSSMEIVLTEGTWEALEVLDEQLSRAMDIKAIGRIGPDGLTEGRYLKRTIRWTR